MFANAHPAAALRPELAPVPLGRTALEDKQASADDVQRQVDVRYASAALVVTVCFGSRARRYDLLLRQQSTAV